MSFLNPGYVRWDGTKYTTEQVVELVYGPTGATGAQGSPGITGVTGPQGSPGVTGPQGVTGPRGATGPQGIIGVTGPQGSPGVTGPQGPTGARGATGVTGPQGVTGVTGPQGPQGPKGSTGHIGSTGIQGPQGSPGVTGARGATGVTGPQGATGVAGSSLFNIASPVIYGVLVSNGTSSGISLASGFQYQTPSGSFNMNVDMYAVLTAKTGMILNSNNSIILQNTSQNVLEITSTGPIVSPTKILSTSGSGNINLPNSGGIGFQIDGYSVGTTVQATGLNIITNGSNADNYHTHNHVTVVDVGVAMTPYTALLTDRYLSIDPSSGAITINLPSAPTNGQQITFKNKTDSNNNITITRAGSQTIDGASPSIVMSTARASITLTYNAVATDWEIS